MSTVENLFFKCYRKTAHPRTSDEGQGWIETEVNDTLNIYDNSETRTPTLVCKTYDARGNGGGNVSCTITGGHQSTISDYTAIAIEGDEVEMVVRRLTPLECERLQGYPDGYTDIGEWVDSKGKKRKEADSPRYKALGNSIALPFWEWMAKRICDQYDRPVTMASLFDGIGGFPLVFQRCGATPVWASEIEEFPIAVTKRHFPEEGGNNNEA